MVGYWVMVSSVGVCVAPTGVGLWTWFWRRGDSVGEVRESSPWLRSYPPLVSAISCGWSPWVWPMSNRCCDYSPHWTSGEESLTGGSALSLPISLQNDYYHLTRLQGTKSPSVPPAFRHGPKSRSLRKPSIASTVVPLLVLHGYLWSSRQMVLLRDTCGLTAGLCCKCPCLFVFERWSGQSNASPHTRLHF